MSLNLTHSDDLLLQWGEPGTRTAGMVRSLHPGAWRSPTEEEQKQQDMEQKWQKAYGQEVSEDELPPHLQAYSAHRSRLLALAPDLIQALEDCLPLVDDARNEAAMDAEENPAWAEVKAAFDEQAASIRALLDRAAGIPNSIKRQLKEQNSPDKPVHARFLNEGATLVIGYTNEESIDGFDASVSLEAEDDNSQLLDYIFQLINKTDPPNYQDKEPTHG